MMDRMEPIHGRLLAQDGVKVLLEEVEGFLGWHPRRDGSKTYFGFFGVPAGKSKGLDGDSAYRLVLDDGRAGEIYADIHPGQVAGALVAEFHVAGKLG